jgi:hypothetical protein
MNKKTINLNNKHPPSIKNSELEKKDLFDVRII